MSRAPRRPYTLDELSDRLIATEPDWAPMSLSEAAHTFAALHGHYRNADDAVDHFYRQFAEPAVAEGITRAHGERFNRRLRVDRPKRPRVSLRTDTDRLRRDHPDFVRAHTDWKEHAEIGNKTIARPTLADTMAVGFPREVPASLTDTVRTWPRGWGEGLTRTVYVPNGTVGLSTAMNSYEVWVAARNVYDWLRLEVKEVWKRWLALWLAVDDTWGGRVDENRIWDGSSTYLYDEWRLWLRSRTFDSDAARLADPGLMRGYTTRVEKMSAPVVRIVYDKPDTLEGDTEPFEGD